ncbi:MAG: DNA-binding protein [Spirochaetales bacterium]|nr:DNA-binding protein [Spirochaetales bacterium]
MKSAELKLGRTFGINIDHGEDFFEQIKNFCAQNKVRQGYIPSFVGGFRHAEIIGACQKVEDMDAPDFTRVYLEYAEAVGAGTIAFDEKIDDLSFHIHVTMGLRAHSATAYTGHLLSGKVQYLSEMILHEVLEPSMIKQVNKDLYNISVLNFI